MVQVKTLDCASCGGPLEVPPGRDVIECSYCGRVLAIGRDRTSTEDADPRTLVDDLLRGYDGEDKGRGSRYGVQDMKTRDWSSWERGVWPVSARSSSTFGQSWSHESTRGAPRVYPRYGDIGGAWAPRRRTSHTEWLEVLYPPGAPPVDAIRVFETCAAGSTFAVTVRAADGSDRLVWKQSPRRPMAEAQVLEIALDEPMVATAVRAYVTNDHRAWTQIDTIGLMAIEPVPMALRKRPAPPPRGRASLVIAAVTMLVLLGGGFALYQLATSMKTTDSPGATASADPTAEPPVILRDSTLAPWSIEKLGQHRDIVWATRGVDASSEFQADDWSRRQLVGPPDVYPAHGDHQRAWATRGENDGLEWVTVEFARSIDARGVVVVETFNPGAIVRIDDLSRPGETVGLWSGSTAPARTSRLLHLALPTARPITRLRLLLDTRKVPGWNEIDAVGLLPARRPPS